MPDVEGRSQHHKRRRNRHSGGTGRHAWRPESIHSYNHSEFIAGIIRRWLKLVDVETLCIEPGSRRENGYAESFHSRLRDAFLAIEEFESLTAARRLSTLWHDDDNLNRPYRSLEYQTSAEFAARCAASTPTAPALQQHSELT